MSLSLIWVIWILESRKQPTWLKRLVSPFLFCSYEPTTMLEHRQAYYINLSFKWPICIDILRLLFLPMHCVFKIVQWELGGRFRKQIPARPRAIKQWQQMWIKVLPHYVWRCRASKSFKNKQLPQNAWNADINYFRFNPIYMYLWDEGSPVVHLLLFLLLWAIGHWLALVKQHKERKQLMTHSHRRVKNVFA